MDYRCAKLPKRTIELLKIVSENDGKIDPVLMANGCSDDENWVRMGQLLELGLVKKEQGYDSAGFENGAVLIMTNEGRSLLSDIRSNSEDRIHERIITGVISAVTAAAVAWGPNILNWLLSLKQQ